jgi:hypothetical protein
MGRSLLASTFAVAALAAGLTLTHPGGAHADLIKLDLLLKSCSSASAVTRADCSAYIAGVSDTLEEAHEICPGGAVLKAVREMVAGYLQSHKFPAQTHAAPAVSEALKAGYACKKP